MTRREVITDGAAAALFLSSTQSNAQERIKETVRGIPEYNRTARKVFFSFDNALSHKLKEEGVFPEGVLDLLNTLPSYTQVEIAVPTEKDARRLRATLREKLSRTRRISYNIVGEELGRQRYFQDIGELVSDKNGKQRLLVPSRAFSEHPTTAQEHEQIASRALHLSPSPVDVYFQGGNMVIDTREKPRVFIGSNDIRDTQLVRNESREVCTERLEAKIPGSKVIVVPSEGLQHPDIFHLDQSFCILPNKQILFTAITCTEGDMKCSEVKTYQDAVRSTMEGEGYRVIEIHHTLGDVENVRFSVNGIIFKNEETGRYTYLLPVFPGEYSENEPLSAQTLTGKAATVRDALQNTDASIDVVPIRDWGAGGKSNLHCLTQIQ